MKIEVNENVIDKTTHCDHDFLCLSDEWKQCGIVKALIADNLLYVDFDWGQRRNCSYMVSFGSGYYCTCPIRIEIYKRYGI